LTNPKPSVTCGVSFCQENDRDLDPTAQSPSFDDLAVKGALGIVGEEFLDM